MAATKADVATAKAVFRKYFDRYDSEVQGCCPLIADEIRKAVGGEIVAGDLTWYGGTCRRTHWWVELEGTVLDPMGDWFLEKEDGPGRTEEHRDIQIFEAILPRYERWRVEGCTSPPVEVRLGRAGGPAPILAQPATQGILVACGRTGSFRR